jgi:NAD(P)-dependent dehydrogenase (short-subunit alcohol dehydrogenase family)
VLIDARPRAGTPTVSSVDLAGARTLVAGATGVLGGALARALHRDGARVAVAGRDEQELAALASELDGAPAFSFDAQDRDRCAAVVEQAAEALGGLDLLVVAIGVAAFGPGDAADDGVVEQLLAVNTTAPMALVRAAVPRMGSGGTVAPRMGSGGTVAVLTAILADYPTAGMAAYSASKAGLSAWLTALRPELRRRGIGVFDVRPPHIETGLAERAISGTAPPMTAGATVDEVVGLIVDGIRTGRPELRYDLMKGEFAGR